MENTNVATQPPCFEICSAALTTRSSFFFFFSADDCLAVTSQIPTATSHRGGDRRRRGGHEQRGQNPNLHLPREPVYSRHCLPEHRRKRWEMGPDLILEFIKTQQILSGIIEMAFFVIALESVVCRQMHFVYAGLPFFCFRSHSWR